MKYKKKPVVIEAFQYDGDLIGSNGQYYVPEWAKKHMRTAQYIMENLTDSRASYSLRHWRAFIMQV